MEIIKNIYRQFKKIPVIGWLLKIIRDAIFNKYFNAFLLYKRDLKAISDILFDICGDAKRVKKIMAEAKKSIFMKKNFSHGQSCNYQVLFLYGLTRIMQPESAIETGVASGRSSTAILEAMNKNKKGRLHSIDLFQTFSGDKPETFITKEGNQENAGFIPEGKKPGWLVPDEFRNKWELILGDTKKKLPELVEHLGEVDFFYHDSEHSYENMSFEFNAVWPIIKSGGFLVCDDYKWNNAFAEFVAKNANGKKVFRYRSFGVVGK